MRQYKTLPDIFGHATLADMFFMPPEIMLKDLPPEQREAFMDVLEHPDFTIHGLKKEDAFTKVAFKHPFEGENEYPLTPEAAEAGVQPLTGVIGYMHSRYHLEDTLYAHTAIVVGQMNDMLYQVCSCGKQGYGEDDVVIPTPYVICAFFHDIGKKWCACTNINREISSYGHAECSAYVANYWLKKVKKLEPEMRQMIVSAIYGHDLIKRWSPDSDYKLRVYQETMGGIAGDEARKDGEIQFPGFFKSGQNRIIQRYTETLADADLGVSKIILDSKARESGYILSGEHFSQYSGKAEPKDETVTNDEFTKLIVEGISLVEKVFKDENQH